MVYSFWLQSVLYRDKGRHVEGSRTEGRKRKDGTEGSHHTITPCSIHRTSCRCAGTRGNHLLTSSGLSVNFVYVR